MRSFFFFRGKMLLVNVCPVKDPTRLTVISLISGAWLYRCKLTHFCTLRKEEIHFVAFIVMPAVILQSAYSNRRSQHYICCTLWSMEVRGAGMCCLWSVWLRLTGCSRESPLLNADAISAGTRRHILFCAAHTHTRVIFPPITLRGNGTFSFLLSSLPPFPSPVLFERGLPCPVEGLMLNCLLKDFWAGSVGLNIYPSLPHICSLIHCFHLRWWF